MSNTILYIFAIYGVAYLIKQSEILSKPRNFLLRNSVFFYQMLDCWACTTFHAGYITYMLVTPVSQLYWRTALLWSLAGIPIGLIINQIINKLYEEK